MFSKELQALISPKFSDDILLKILKENNALNDIKITEIVIDRSTSKGDSYLSNLCKFKVRATGKELNSDEEKEIECPVVAKAIIKNPGRRETFRSKDFFVNEIIFYEKVWPAFEKFQNSKKNIAVKFDGIPKLLSSYLGGIDDYVALEDLTYQGFGAMPRSSGLNYQQTLSILKLFAHFHSLNLAFKDQNKKEFETAVYNLKETYFAEKFFNWYNKFQKSLMNITRDSVEKELVDKIYLEKLNAIFDNDFYKKICEQCQPRGSFSVVTHGDAWLPNFLFKFDNDNNPEKIMMIDFQLTRYASIANDLIFFLYSCATPEILNNHWNDLLEEYFNDLTFYIEVYGSKDLITLQDLKNEIKNSIIYGIGMSMEALVMSLIDDDEVADVDSIQGDVAIPLETIWVVHPFKDQEKRKRVAAMIKHAVDYKLI